MEVKNTERSEVVVMHGSTRGLAPARPERRPVWIFASKNNTYGQLPERKDHPNVQFAPVYTGFQMGSVSIISIQPHMN